MEIGTEWYSCKMSLNEMCVSGMIFSQWVSQIWLNTGASDLPLSNCNPENVE